MVQRTPTHLVSSPGRDKTGFFRQEAPIQAGYEIAATVPAEMTWRILVVRFTLTTSAVVGNRRVSLVFDSESRRETDGTKPEDSLAPVDATWSAEDSMRFLRLAAGADQAASQVRTYYWVSGALASDTAFNADGELVTALPRDFIVPAGWTVGSLTSGLDTGDLFEDDAYWIEEK